MYTHVSYAIYIHTVTYLTARVLSGGIDPDDIKQGNLGNCYFLAAIAAVASQQVHTILILI